MQTDGESFLPRYPRHSFLDNLGCSDPAQPASTGRRHLHPPCSSRQWGWRPPHCSSKLLQWYHPSFSTCCQRLKCHQNCNGAAWQFRDYFGGCRHFKVCVLAGIHPAMYQEMLKSCSILKQSHLYLGNWNKFQWNKTLHCANNTCPNPEISVALYQNKNKLYKLNVYWFLWMF